MIGSALQKAIFAALNAAPALAGGRIYDRVAAPSAFPYIKIGAANILDDGNSCDDGWDASYTIHVWSRPVAGSKVEVADLVASIVPRLVTTLTVSGFTVIIAELEGADLLDDPDGITMHGIVRVRYVLQPA